VELRWRGKETKVKTVSLPFQTVERIDLWSAQASPEQRAAFEQMRQADPRWEGWANRLIWGDNKNVMASLLDEFEGEIDLIYIDLPFATGATFKAQVEVGFYDTPGDAYGVVVMGNYAYVADGGGGLVILRFAPFRLTNRS